MAVVVDLDEVDLACLFLKIDVSESTTPALSSVEENENAQMNEERSILHCGSNASAANTQNSTGVATIMNW